MGNTPDPVAGTPWSAAMALLRGGWEGLGPSDSPAVTVSNNGRSVASVGCFVDAEGKQQWEMETVVRREKGDCSPEGEEGCWNTGCCSPCLPTGHFFPTLKCQ